MRFTLVTLLGVTCAMWESNPLTRAPARHRASDFRRSPTYPVGGFVLAFVL